MLVEPAAQHGFTLASAQAAQFARVYGRCALLRIGLGFNQVPERRRINKLLDMRACRMARARPRAAHAIRTMRAQLSQQAFKM